MYEACIVVEAESSHVAVRVRDLEMQILGGEALRLEGATRESDGGLAQENFERTSRSSYTKQRSDVATSSPGRLLVASFKFDQVLSSSISSPCRRPIRITSALATSKCQDVQQHSYTAKWNTDVTVTVLCIGVWRPCGANSIHGFRLQQL